MEIGRPKNEDANWSLVFGLPFSISSIKLRFRRVVDDHKGVIY